MVASSGYLHLKLWANPDFWVCHWCTILPGLKWSTTVLTAYFSHLYFNWPHDTLPSYSAKTPSWIVHFRSCFQFVYYIHLWETYITRLFNSGKEIKVSILRFNFCGHKKEFDVIHFMPSHYIQEYHHVRLFYFSFVMHDDIRMDYKSNVFVWQTSFHGNWEYWTCLWWHLSAEYAYADFK